MHSYKILSESEITQALTLLPGWNLNGPKLHAHYIFKNFKEAINFMNEVVPECEKLDHHPLWANSYNRVEISLCTHAVGDKITDYDVKLATLICDVATKYGLNTSN